MSLMEFSIVLSSPNMSSLVSTSTDDKMVSDAVKSLCGCCSKKDEALCAAMGLHVLYVCFADLQ